MMTATTDRIEKRILLRAPQDRVWRALAGASEFGDWFGMELHGEFRPGAEIRGRIKPTLVDEDVAKMQESLNGMALSFFVEEIVPMSKFSYRWHPFAIDPSVDYSREPMTLVTFTLEAVEGGTMLTVVESGFDAIPIERRANAFEANGEGWSMQMQVLEKYLVQFQR